MPSSSWPAPCSSPAPSDLRSAPGALPASDQATPHVSFRPSDMTNALALAAGAHSAGGIPSPITILLVVSGIGYRLATPSGQPDRGATSEQDNCCSEPRRL